MSFPPDGTGRPFRPAPATGPDPGRRQPRLDERFVLRVGLMLSAGFVAVALAAYALPAVVHGHWAGLHLALAGAATVAIGTFMPHFGVTLAGSVSEPASLRMGGVAALAAGAALVVIGMTAPAVGVTLTGAGLLWIGLAITAWTTLRPGLRPLARRHPIAQLAYAVALLDVAIGIGLPVLLLLGWEPALAGWARLQPAHVWLNVFGFLSLTISATLVYLYPTIVGARIRATPSLAIMVGGGIAGPPLVAVGAIIDASPVAVVGAAITLAGAAGQVAYALDAWRRRGRWTTDAGWHRLTAGHLSAAMAWYLAAVATAAVGILNDGPAPAAWSIGPLAIPLVAGWALQVLAGAWAHLLPAVASTDPARRARQRSVLGTAALTRLVAWNAGALLGWAGLATRSLPVAVAGMVLFIGAIAVAIGLLVRALWPAGAGSEKPRADIPLPG